MHKLTKTLLFIVLIIIIGLLIITKINTSSQITITVPSEDYKKYLQEEVIPVFEKENKHIKININYVSKVLDDDYERNISANILKFLPQTDLFLGVSYSQFRQIDKSQLVNLAPFFRKTNFDIKKIYTPIAESINQNGNIYAIPMGFYNYAIAYNKNIFENLKIKEPVDNMTWNEVMTIADTIHNKSPETKGIALRFDSMNSLSTTLQKLTLPFEGNFYNKSIDGVMVNKEKVSGFLNLYKNGINKGYIAPSILDFFRGNTAMAFIGLYDLDVYNNAHDPSFKKFPYKVISAPKFSDLKTSYVIPGDMFIVSKYSKKQNDAWKFIDFMIKGYYQFMDPGSFGWFPVYINHKEPVIKKHYEINFEAFYTEGKVINQDLPFFDGNQFNIYNQISSQIFEDYVNGKIPEVELGDILYKKLNQK
jgi:ABC-type glycerol-3-phosphate transport system substrate-binding protein